MKKQKSSLLHRMLAVLLAAVLVTGMVSNAAPASVLAQADIIGGSESAGWTLAADGRLTISSDAGMEGWENYMRGDYEYYTRQVVNVEIQDGVTSLGNNAFYNYGELTGITIADSVTSIAGSAFCGCWKLRKITIPNNVTSISDRMFMNSGLEEITILGSVTSIGEFAFYGCGLTKITIPDSVKSIGEKAFIYCDNLNEVIIKSETPPTLGDGVFTDCGFVIDNTQSIHVPEGKAQAYKTAWTDWAAYIADGTPTPPAGEHEHNDVTFTAWTATDGLPTTAGNYYLTENVTLSATWNVPDGETSICLNGKTITQTTDRAWVVSIGSGSTLKLYDCGDAGKITREGNGKSAGSVSVGDGAAFYMYGGNISGNISNCPAVYVVNKGEFNMSGGRIADNENSGTSLEDAYVGGGVNVNNGTFRMSGGEISRNSGKDDYRGGVYLCNGGVFYMSGGKISENKNGVYVSQLAAFHMSGGEVSGNTGAYGGGVRSLGTMTAGGNIVITGNTGKDGEEKNLFIGRLGSIRIDTSNPLADSANIGVTTQTAPTDASPVNITRENGADYSRHFHSDNADYEIINGENNVVQLAVKASPDTQPPTGKIEVEDNSWTSFLNAITFGLFFKEEKNVTITAEDEGSGVDKIYYHLSDVAMTEEEVKKLGANEWQEGAFFSIAPDRKCIIYAKITDKAGNITYLSSGGLVFDATPPVINGVMDGETYNAPQTVTVTDATSGVKSVMVNGTEVPLTDNQFTLGTADGSQTIVATDQAGNTTTVTVTVQAQTQTQSYAVTVRNGTGTGIYRAGDTVEITANAPAGGKQFDRWRVVRGGVTLADPTSSTTTFTMPERDVEIEATYKDITEEHTHNYGDWQHDSTQHWKVCSCGDETGRGNHDYGDWITDKAAMAIEAGTKHRECQTCGYRQTETIPAMGGDPGSGTVTPEVRPGTNAPATNISTPAEELKDMLLTEEEKQQVQNGTNIRIVLEVQDAGNTVSVSERAAVAQALNGYTVGQYLNIDLYKLAGADRTDITETAKKIRIVITVPDSLKNADSSKTRTFAVIRVHDGKAELLTDLDDSDDTITIETDRFSTYAVVYKDMADGNGGSGNNDNNNKHSSSSSHSSPKKSAKNEKKPEPVKDNEPRTGDETPIEIYATLAMIAGFAYLLLYFADRKKGMTEKTKKELVTRPAGWAKRGGRIRKYLALAAIIVLLVYYHSTRTLYRGIGKISYAKWKEKYGE